MAKRVRAVVNPALLVWARESAGYSRHEVAARFKKSVKDVEGWENGETIYLGQLRELAEFYKRPISDFYLPARPYEKPIPHDFRREPGQVANVYSPALRRQLRLASDRRELALALYAEAEESPPHFVDTISKNDDPEDVGPRLRKLLHVTRDDQATWGDGVRAFAQWRDRLEALGILVFQFERIPTEEVWGFSIVERPLPIIGVNRMLRGNGRTFTLIHEFAHVLIGESSICDIDDFHTRPKKEDALERFCNAVAASVLMPRLEFLSHPLVGAQGSGEQEWDDDTIESISKSFGASREAVVRRLHTFGRTSWNFYLRKRHQYAAELEGFLLRQREENKNKEIRRNMPREALYNLGAPLVRLIIQTYSDNRMSLADASAFLGVKPAKVSKVERLAFGN